MALKEPEAFVNDLKGQVRFYLFLPTDARMPLVTTHLLRPCDIQRPQHYCFASRSSTLLSVLVASLLVHAPLEIMRSLTDTPFLHMDRCIKPYSQVVEHDKKPEVPATAPCFIMYLPWLSRSSLSTNHSKSRSPYADNLEITSLEPTNNGWRFGTGLLLIEMTIISLPLWTIADLFANPRGLPVHLIRVGIRTPLGTILGA